jgi:hypothetical protein
VGCLALLLAFCQRSPKALMTPNLTPTTPWLITILANMNLAPQPSHAPMPHWQLWWKAHPGQIFAKVTKG